MDEASYFAGLIAWFEGPWPWLIASGVAVVVLLDAWDFISLKRIFRAGRGDGGGLDGDGGGDGGE